MPIVTALAFTGAEKASNGIGEAEATEEPFVAVSADLHHGSSRVSLGGTTTRARRGSRRRRRGKSRVGSEMKAFGTVG